MVYCALWTVSDSFRALRFCAGAAREIKIYERSAMYHGGCDVSSQYVWLRFCIGCYATRIRCALLCKYHSSLRNLNTLVLSRIPMVPGARPLQQANSCTHMIQNYTKSHSLPQQISRTRPELSYCGRLERALLGSIGNGCRVTMSLEIVVAEDLEHHDRCGDDDLQAASGQRYIN